MKPAGYQSMNLKFPTRRACDLNRARNRFSLLIAHSIHPLTAAILLTTISIFSPLPSFAASTDDLLARAKNSFTLQQYKQSADIYGQLIEQAPNDPRLLYNQGTAYARMGERGLAQWRYLQALRYAPRDTNIRHNLYVLDPQYQEQIALTPILPLEMLYGYFTGNEWAWIAVSASLAALLLGSFALWRPSGSRARFLARKLAITAAVLASLTWPFVLGHYHQDFISNRGVIVSDEASVRSSPNESSTETWKLKAGQVVDITDDRTNPEWPFISFGGKGSGFVQSTQLKRL